ncbi:MAG: alpha/beta hydrolase [Rhodocyclaceae bacterium]|nr:alpha/beta hydrolase [Rhodocyclaceae bacterium]
MPLDPRARSLLDMAYRVGAPKFHELDEGQARRSMVKLQEAFQPDAPAVASVTEVPIGSSGGVVLARAYRPIGAAPDAVLPVLVFLHGGGWCIGSVETHDVLCRELCNASGMNVLSVDYRLAPEHPFPAAFDDVLATVRWLKRHASEIGADPTRVALAGDSAGGNLALAAALWLRDAGESMVRALGLVYPCVEIFAETDSRRRFAQGFFLDEESLAWFFERYLPHPGDAMDWRASPILAERFDGLPPLSLVTAECDPLVDECEALATRFESCGIEVRRHPAEGMVHGFITLGKMFPQSGRAIAALSADLADFLTCD